jgi:hypothetical protein
MKWIITLLLLTNTYAGADSFEDGKNVFMQKCTECHVGHIDRAKIKENFEQRDNKLYMLSSPSVNMLADAITDNFKQESQVKTYLTSMLMHPEQVSKILDPKMLKFFDEKTALLTNISNGEVAALSRYFMEYTKRRQAKPAPSTVMLNEKYNAVGILSEAQATNKRIIIEASANNCEWCQKMQKEVIDTDEVQKLIKEGYVMVDVNIDKHPLPFDLKNKFKQITPTFFILESDGMFVARYPGSLEKEDFIKLLREQMPKNR